MNDYLSEVFGDGGLFASRFPGYELREGRDAYRRFGHAAAHHGEPQLPGPGDHPPRRREPGYLPQRLLQHLPIQELQRRQRLILCRRGHVPLACQVGQKVPHLHPAERCGMAQAVPPYIAHDPLHIGLRGTRAEATHGGPVTNHHQKA